MTIGERAAQEIRNRVGTAGTLKAELERLECHYDNFRQWGKCNLNPSAYALRSMALHGYDVYYILTGEKIAHET